MNKRIFIGLDLGQQFDYTAMTVVSSFRTGPRELMHTIEYIYRFPLKMSYSVMANSVTRFINTQLKIYSPILIVDFTGVGAPVYDILTKNGLKPVAFTITGGNTPKIVSKYKVNVPKQDMVASLQIALQNNVIRIPSNTNELEQLKAEIQNFTMKINKNNKESFGALQDGIHDDIVMALCMSIWYADFALVGKKTPYVKIGI